MMSNRNYPFNKFKTFIYKEEKWLVSMFRK